MKHIEEKTVEKRGGAIVQKIIVSKKKAEIRNKIEDDCIGKPYDTLDLIADVCNALNDVLAGETDTANITKYKTRQEEIKRVLNG